MAKDLWPEFKVAAGPRSPKTVIEEAGKGLEPKTDNLLKFYSGSARVTDKVELRFTIYSKSLGFHYPFLTAEFAIQPPYPVKLIADKLDPIVAANEEELVAGLGRIFSAPSTVSTVTQLIALSRQ